MLTRLKVSGFKNLVDVDVRFGPFTCIAGANGTGKSNLFDAIGFLSALADKPLVQAALSVRDKEGRSGDLRSLFHRVGNRYDDEMSFIAEMIVSEEGVDDLGQTARASITFLRYSLTLAYRQDHSLSSSGSIEILKEELVHITQKEAKAHLLFPYENTWRKSAVTGRRIAPFISTATEDGTRIIKLHQDGGSSGRPIRRAAANLPRTVLSVANAAESPTALMARREMESWQLLQLEPSALRKPSDFNAPNRLGADGSDLPATLYRLAHEDKNGRNVQAYPKASAQVYTQVANRLAELIDDVHHVASRARPSAIQVSLILGRALAWKAAQCGQVSEEYSSIVIGASAEPRIRSSSNISISAALAGRAGNQPAASMATPPAAAPNRMFLRFM